MKKIIYYASATAAVAYGIKAIAQTMRKPKFNHLALYVVDLNKSTAFYKDIVGLKIIPDPFKDGKHTWFKTGENNQLHLIEGAKEIMPRNMHTHFCFSISSVEDFIAHLTKAQISYTNAKGVAQSVTIRPDGIKQIYFQDPDNYWIEINDDKY